MSRWIKSKERCPSNNRDVLTFGKFGMNIACFEWGTEDDQCWWTEGKPASFKTSVTHWMELPRPPAQGQSGPSSAAAQGTPAGAPSQPSATERTLSL